MRIGLWGCSIPLLTYRRHRAGLQRIRQKTQEGKVSNVVGLYICAGAGQPMEAQSQARALAGCGFAGDRYATNQGTFSRSAVMRHVSLIASEAIEDSNRDLIERELAPFAVHETRRNIITQGVDVNALLGREFRIGDVRMRGTEPTKPCPRPSALAQKAGFGEAFANRGGVRAEVLSDGIISVGDFVTFERLA
jgi:MOSC domain-containing protein YiiM